MSKLTGFVGALKDFAVGLVSGFVVLGASAGIASAQTVTPSATPTALTPTAPAQATAPVASTPPVTLVATTANLTECQAAIQRLHGFQCGANNATCVQHDFDVLPGVCQSQDERVVRCINEVASGRRRLARAQSMREFIDQCVQELPAPPRCRSGQRLEHGRCVNIVPTCSEGQVLNSARNACTCPTGTYTLRVYSRRGGTTPYEVCPPNAVTPQSGDFHVFIGPLTQRVTELERRADENDRTNRRQDVEIAAVESRVTVVEGQVRGVNDRQNGAEDRLRVVEARVPGRSWFFRTGVEGFGLLRTSANQPFSYGARLNIGFHTQRNDWGPNGLGFELTAQFGGGDFGMGVGGVYAAGARLGLVIGLTEHATGRQFSTFAFRTSVEGLGLFVAGAETRNSQGGSFRSFGMGLGADLVIHPADWFGLTFGAAGLFDRNVVKVGPSLQTTNGFALDFRAGIALAF